MRLIAASIVLAGGVIALAFADGGRSRDIGGLVLAVGGIIFAIEYYRAWKSRSD